MTRPSPWRLQIRPRWLETTLHVAGLLCSAGVAMLYGSVGAVFVMVKFFAAELPVDRYGPVLGTLAVAGPIILGALSFWAHIARSRLSSPALIALSLSMLPLYDHWIGNAAPALIGLIGLPWATGLIRVRDGNA